MSNNQENLDYINRIQIISVNNIGAGFSMNAGVKEAIRTEAKVVTIMDDDTILRNFNIVNILLFFSNNIRPDKDLLILADECSLIALNKKRNSVRRWVETGMTFHSELFKRTQFREDFIMDLIDTEFSLKTRKKGGKLIIYPDDVLKNLPIGRAMGHGINHLPNYRIYTLTRNVITLAIENISLETMILVFHEIIYWSVRSLRSGEKTKKVLASIYHGLFDAMKKNTGVTLHLNELSNNRFYFNK